MGQRRTGAIRTVEIRTLLDTVLVSAIATILLIRLQLWATNYPKLGGGKLHIAHLLWGGVAMLVAIVLLLGFLGRGRRHAAAVIGGAGFGFFIDEIGKFVTSNNDYFFKPAAGMIYLVFILLYLIVRSLGWHRPLTPEECLMNAMQLLTEAARGDLHEHDRRMVRALLARSDRAHPLIAPLSGLVDQIECPPRPHPGRVRRFWLRTRGRYVGLIRRRWFSAALIAVFTLVGVGGLLAGVLDAHSMLAGTQPAHVISIAGLVSSVVAAALIALGVSRVVVSTRLAAYAWFDHALMVQIFLTDLFAFLESQFAAAFGLLLHLALIVTLRLMIRAERGIDLFGDGGWMGQPIAPPAPRSRGLNPTATP